MTEPKDLTLEQVQELVTRAPYHKWLGLKVVAVHDDGIEIKANLGADGKPVDGIPFHPYYTMKDGFGVVVFMILYAAFVFFMPNSLGEVVNYVPANPLVTPNEIVPEWYLLPFYAILRSVPSILFIEAKLAGVIAMFASILILLFLPWLDRSPVKSIRYKGLLSKLFLGAFVIAFVVLGYLGMAPAEGLYVLLARIFTVVYFAFFLLMPWYTRIEKTAPVPQRVTSHA